VLKLARTIANLAGAEDRGGVSEALQYQVLDRVRSRAPMRA
jgi:hypothetical protein